MPTTPVTTSTSLGAFEDLFNAGPAVAPTACTLGSGWSLFGSEPCTAERVQGMVTVYISLAKAGASTAGETLCTLPANCWPKRTVRALCNNGGAGRAVTISTSGVVSNDVAQSAGQAAMLGTIVFAGA